jgi:MarR family transcriptional regulator for hemolysin
VGRQLALTAKAVAQAFNSALADAGGSIPVWLILSALERDRWRTQHELAGSLGIEGATLTRHLDALERAGLVARVRGSADRRAVHVEATAAGRELHERLLEAALAFDRRLRSGVSKQELDELARLLERLEQNVGPDFRAAPRQL